MTAKAYGPFHIPLRVRRVAPPYRTPGEYVDYIARIQGSTWSTGSKKLQLSPNKMDFECPAYPEWHVETFTWYVPGAQWRVLQRFATKEEAIGFCERWRKQEREDEVHDSVLRGMYVD